MESLDRSKEKELKDKRAANRLHLAATRVKGNRSLPPKKREGTVQLPYRKRGRIKTKSSIS